jgi:Zn-dependent protease with chaperone function
MSGQPRPRRLACPACGTALVAPGGAEAGDEVVVVCPGCGESVRARRRNAGGVPPPPPSTSTSTETPRGLGLAWRARLLVALERACTLGTGAGALALLACGGFVPVLRRWLDDELDGWGGVVTTLGGVRVEPPRGDPDADLGPALARGDAPALFDEVERAARHVGVRPPGQVRVSYLPCCGAVAWGRGDRARALIVGLPLLYVLTRAELRGVLAHELAHLARGDATRAARAVRFVEALDQALAAPGSGPLGWWARGCGRLGRSLIAPVARGQELRADRAAAALVGGERAASALIKVALVQPLFREVLAHYAPPEAGEPTLYAFFRDFWGRLPEPVRTAMRHRLLTARSPQPSPTHPDLLDRLDALRDLPEPPCPPPHDGQPAGVLVGDLEALERMLHDRLYARPAPEPTIFHRAGS